VATEGEGKALIEEWRGRERENEPMTMHILDCSALNALIEPDQIHVRNDLVRQTKYGGLLVPATWPLVWEVAATRAVNDTKYRKMIEFLFQISSRSFLATPNERMLAEMKAGGSVGVPGCLDEDRELMPLADAELVDAAAKEHLDRARDQLIDEVAQAEDTAVTLLAKELEHPGSRPWRKILKEGFRQTKQVYDLADHYPPASG
jgi:hypothetical protein